MMAQLFQELKLPLVWILQFFQLATWPLQSCLWTPYSNSIPAPWYSLLLTFPWSVITGPDSGVRNQPLHCCAGLVPSLGASSLFPPHALRVLWCPTYFDHCSNLWSSLSPRLWTTSVCLSQHGSSSMVTAHSGLTWPGVVVQAHTLMAPKDLEF